MVAESLAQQPGVGVDCASSFQAEFAAVWTDLKNPAGLAPLQARLSLCEPVQTPSDVYELLYWAKTAVSQSVQCSYQRGGPPTDVPYSIGVMCSAAYPLRAAVDMIYNSTRAPVQCYPYKLKPAHIHMHMHAQGLGLALDAPYAYTYKAPLPIQTLPFHYICCVQFVMPVAGTSIFSVPHEFSMALLTRFCEGTYGVAPDPKWYIGGLYRTLPSLTNVIFSNGALDPVRGFSPSQNVGPTAIALVVDNMGHTYDLFADSPADPPNIIAARAQELSILRGWLNF